MGAKCISVKIDNKLRKHANHNPLTRYNWELCKFITPIVALLYRT